MNRGDDLFVKRILKLQDELYIYAYSLTINIEDAKDLLQETLLKALDNRDKYVDNTNLKGWMLTIMKHIFINNYRRTSYTKTIIDQTEELYYLNHLQNADIETPESLLAVQDIKQTIASFPKDYKVILSMLIAGLKYSEIADRLNISAGTVKSRIFYMRQRLHILLKDYR
ncbi:MAG: RNA polymerase sigma factor [Bacteroidales bacterium]|nr:RNA polymerase sigma factor [Bacteroidales bacterium]